MSAIIKVHINSSFKGHVKKLFNLLHIAVLGRTC